MKKKYCKNLPSSLSSALAPQNDDVKILKSMRKFSLILKTFSLKSLSVFSSTLTGDQFVHLDSREGQCPGAPSIGANSYRASVVEH